MNDLLTNEEKYALGMLASVSSLMHKIIGAGSQAGFDWAEAADKIHQLQRMIMAQAAARVYPQDYRLLGNSLQSGDYA